MAAEGLLAGAVGPAPARLPRPGWPQLPTPGRGGTRRGLRRFQIIELCLQILDLRLVLLLEASDLGLVLLLDCCDFGLVFLLDCSDRVLQLSDLITHIRRSLGYSGHRQNRACNGDHSRDRPQMSNAPLPHHCPPRPTTARYAAEFDNRAGLPLAARAGRLGALCAEVEL
jgi:hypothetical protein